MLRGGTSIKKCIMICYYIRVYERAELVQMVRVLHMLYMLYTLRELRTLLVLRALRLRFRLLREAVSYHSIVLLVSLPVYGL